MPHQSISRTHITLIGVVLLGLVFTVVAFVGGFGKCEAHEWQLIQAVSGKLTVRDAPGWYLRMFASVWDYPRAVQEAFTKPSPEQPSDESIAVTFNDGGTAIMVPFIMYETPKTQDMRLNAHRDFGSVSGMTASVRAHMINCMKATAPLMSASEHQSARKSEFRQVVEEQLRDGLYEMRKVERILSDETDESSRQIKVFATEIIRDKNGKPVIAQESPLKKYGLNVVQFSIKETEYDDKTLEKFAAKKEAFLRAEQAKADRENEVQQRLMIIERGKRELAEVEAAANKEKMTATVNADREAQVAKIEAEQKVVVAEATKREAETKSQQLVEVAKLALQEADFKQQTAAKEAEAIRVLADAEKERIEKGGAITEEQRVLAEIDADKQARIAEALAKVNVPSTMIIGGGEGGGQNQMSNLINLFLMQQTGIMPRSTLTARIQAEPETAK